MQNVQGREHVDVNLDASQLSAISRACSSRVSIITGGAGTGKTTIIKAVSDKLSADGEDVSLCAFAGKAAARVREACSRPASTIHRMLGYDGRAYRVDSLSGRSIIVDEASMIDAALMAEIVKRQPRSLVLVGDPAQLPPVGRGQPFHDLIRLRPELVSTLTTCYRATEAVYQAASAVRAGARPPMHATSDGESWTMLNTGSPSQTQAALLSFVNDGVIDWETDIILCARNGDGDGDSGYAPSTVRGLNRAIVDLVSPRDWKDKHQRWKPGDRCINTKNLPDLDCWNGTTGTVHAVDTDGGVWVRLDIPAMIDGRPTSHVLFGRDIRGHLQLAYALTVHKAQGSQYRRVIFAGFDRDLYGLLDRSLFYTAITRTKQDCMVVGELSAAWAAVERENHKRTVMQEVANEE